MRAIALVLTVALSLASAGCGLRPLYAGGGSGQVATSLASVQVAAMPEKAGWLMRNALVDRLGGEPGQARYRLDVELDDDLSGLGIRGDSAVTRERRTLRARYQLIDLQSGLVVLDATAGSDAGIDVVSSEYATVAAENSAQERLTKVVADQIVSRLGLFMSRQGQ